MPKRPTRSLPHTVYDFRIELRDIRPLIWRQVIVPSIMHLEPFHRVIQECFGWRDYHLYRFEFRDRAFERATEESDAEDAGEVPFYSMGLTKGDTILYTYDFGDDWQVDIRVLEERKIDHTTFYPVCVDGARAGPLEDSGGPHGYKRLLSVLADPKHPDFLELREWAGPHFQPETFDLRATNRILQLAFGIVAT